MLDDLNASMANLLIAHVAHEFGVGDRQLFATKKMPAHLCYIRQAAMYLAHTSGQHSYSAIAGVFGRDPSTVSYACAVIETLREDTTFNQKMEQLEAFLMSANEGLYCQKAWG